MNTVFIGGSRHVSRLPSEVRKRLDKVVASGHQVIVGDANGADKAVQKFFFDVRYENVTVFCSGLKPRNNLGSWPIHPVSVPANAKGFQFYAAKDREMARQADIGFMIWDGKSPGTALNVLRLVRAGKISVLFNVPEMRALNIKSMDQWRDFITKCNTELQADIKQRATSEEWSGEQIETDSRLLLLLDEAPAKASEQGKGLSAEETASALNKALAIGDATAVINAIGAIVRDRRIDQVANTRRAGESIGRTLDGLETSDFATVLKVLSSIGLRLEAKAARDVVQRASDRRREAL
jgi:DNA-binding phage protein